MKGDFSFCGIDIADIGLEYAPENKDTYVYAPAESELHEEIFEGHDGGYSYGVYKKPKEFTLRCIYEDTNIAKGLMAKAYNLFRVGRKGVLIFKRRPWCYYYATVTGVDAGDIHTYLSGIFVVTMKAYYPYARGLNITGDISEEAAHKHLFYNLSTDNCHEEIIENTAVLDKEYMVPAMSFNSIPESGSLLLYNPGTERAKVNIVLSGTAGQGIVIANRTTMQSCRYQAFTNNSGDIVTDGINGKTITDKNGVKELAFLYHDYGFIELEPAFPIVRDLSVSYSNQTVTVTNTLYEEEDEKTWYEDKYIFLGTNSSGQWYQINRCTDEHTLTLKKAVSNSGSCQTCVVLMNEIQITTGQDTVINKLSFIYKPTDA